MKLKISELFELYDGDEAKSENVSAERITELTMNKIKKDKSSGERKKLGKPLKFTLIAAAAVVLVVGSAMAVHIFSIPGETNAVRMANRELLVLKDMGILTGEFQLPESGCQIRLSGDLDNPDNPWLNMWGRTFNPFYDIYYYDEEGSISVGIDTVTGKLISWNIYAIADEDAPPVMQRVAEDGEILKWYANYEDIFDSEMSVDEMCEKLCDYWNFKGYSIGETVMEYGESYDIIDSAAQLKDAGNYPWLTIYFDGDQEGAAQFIEIESLGKGAAMMVGYMHAVG